MYFLCLYLHAFLCPCLVQYTLIAHVLVHVYVETAREHEYIHTCYLAVILMYASLFNACSTLHVQCIYTVHVHTSS